ncbi:MAG: hypothetical protein WCK47_07040 [bacterium]|nr:hypothetical protein [Candidatus Sumerlaeota bacterium]
MQRSWLLSACLAVVIAAAAASAFAQNYALGKSVTVTPEFPAGYWVNGGTTEIPHLRMTDGLTSTGGDDWSVMGAWDNTLMDPVEIIIDLDTVKTDIGAAQVDNAVNPWGMKACNAISIYGSMDGTAFTKWGNLTTTNTATNANYEWRCSGVARSARYVKFILNWPYPGAGAEGIYEIAVHGGGTPGPYTDNYAWDMTVQAIPEFPGDYWVNSSVEAAHMRMTDGATASTGEDWTKMAAYDAANAVTPTYIIVDMQSVKTDIASVRVDNPVKPSSGPKPCDSITVSGSTNNTDYMPWGSLTTTGTGSNDMYPWIWSGGPVEARYVKFEFNWPNPGSGSQAFYEVYVFSTQRNPSGVPEWGLY